MAITREFIGWDGPVLPRAVDFLMDRYGLDGNLNLGDVIVVVPGRRAGRRLLELLVEAAAEQCPEFVPPQIETVGSLPDLFFENQLQYADTLIQNLVWAEVLREADRTTLRAVVPEVPDRDDTDAWMQLANLIRQQHRELAAEAMDFENVASACRQQQEPAEAGRWAALRKVQLDYFNRMDEIRYWDRQTARLEAVKREECVAEKDIVLVATVDLNRATRDMLALVSDRVTTLVAAPPDQAAGFDEFGTLVPDVWREERLDLSAAQVEVVDRPDDQAAEVIETVNGFDGRYRADEITVGVADDRLVPHLQRHFDECNVSSRWFEGRRLEQTPPYRLLQLLADFIAGLLPGNRDARAWNFEALAALVRHPDLFNWIEQNFATPRSRDGKGPSHWLMQLDEYRAEHLQPRPGVWLRRSRYSDGLQMLWTRIGDLVSDFAPASESGSLFAEIARLDEWVAPLRKFLQTVYKSRSFSPDDEADEVAAAALRRFDQILFAFQKIPDAVLPMVNASNAIRMLLQQCAGEFVPPPRDDSAVELLGWLELVLDDAPALIVTSFNEQFVPQSVTSDIFLPNQLRRRLQLNDNAQRYARDAYALRLLLSSRESLKLIVGRSDDNNDPLSPSRLLFATDPEEIPSRVLQFYPEHTETTRVVARSRLHSVRLSSGFTIPEPQKLEKPITSLRVTQFKSYLECPYRFYLRHILRLDEVDDSPREMDPRQFGTVLHDVLDRFGRDETIRSAANAEAIEEFLNAEVTRVVKWRFGVVRTAATDVQIQRLRLRLEMFACWQAQRVAQGWRIRYAEENDPDQRADVVDFPIGDGQTIQLRGRIDRIDENVKTGEWVIFDYKSSDSGKSPEETHIRRNRSGPDRWVDLQLPLYRHLARALPVDGGQEYKVGYILLPGDLGKVGDAVAGWKPSDFEEADELARQIATRVVSEKFWPPAANVEWPDFERICQDAVYDREVAL